jgi:hypothetical protein
MEFGGDIGMIQQPEITYAAKPHLSRWAMIITSEILKKKSYTVDIGMENARPIIQNE